MMYFGHCCGRPRDVAGYDLIHDSSGPEDAAVEVIWSAWCPTLVCDW